MINSNTNQEFDSINDRAALLHEKSNESRWSAYRNLLSISVAFLLIFSSYHAMANLQSSINTNDNIGVTSLAIIYAFLIVSSAFLSPTVIGLFGYKWTIVISQVPYLLFIMANYDPKPLFMYPAAALLGLAAGCLWPASYSFVTDIACTHAQTVSIDKDITVSQFMGIFSMSYQSTQIWGNLISFLILVPQQNQNGNNTTSTNQIKYDQCGAQFNQKEYHVTETVLSVDETTFHILCLTFISLSIVAIVITVIFLTYRRTTITESISTLIKSSIQYVASTFKHMGQTTQILLIPLNIWIGLEDSFLSAWFTKAFVTCTLNPKYIGLVYIVTGICASLMSLTVTSCVKLIGRKTILIMAAILTYILIIIMFLWQPQQDQLFLLCILAGLWGISQAICYQQLTVLYGLLFQDQSEAGFSNFCFWESIGSMIFFIMMPHFRTTVALIILFIMLSIGLCGYFVVEFRKMTTE